MPCFSLDTYCIFTSVLVSVRFQKILFMLSSVTPTYKNHQTPDRPLLCLHVTTQQRTSLRWYLWVTNRLSQKHICTVTLAQSVMPYWFEWYETVFCTNKAMIRKLPYYKRQSGRSKNSADKSVFESHVFKKRRNVQQGTEETSQMRG